MIALIFNQNIIIRMFEELRQSANQLVGQALGIVAIDKCVIVGAYDVVGRIHKPDGADRMDTDLAYIPITTDSPKSVTIIPRFKVGPFNTPFLNRNAAFAVEPSRVDVSA
jgi:hypothetical protein